MERKFEKTLGTALVAIGLAILLFGFYQAYTYTQSPPSGQYKIFNIGGGAGSGSGNNGGNFSGSFNGIFLVTFMFLVIEYLVGASILRAGWNLVTPKAETIQVRVKPRSLQVEPVGPSVPPTPVPAVPPAAAANPPWSETEGHPPASPP